MADIFEKQNAIDLLKNKRVVFFGGSNVRHLYKDLIWLLNKNSLIRLDLLRKRGEDSFEGDKLIGPCKLNACRDYRENRQYQLKGFNIEFFFITRCLNEQIGEYMKKIKSKEIPAPDVVIMNSTLWDLNRWGPNGVKDFKSNMVTLMKLLNESLPESTMFIWTTAVPPGKNIRKGSLLIKQVEFLEHTLRFEVMEANLYAKTVVVKYGYDVLDLHYHLRMQIHRRHNDGLHYNSLPIRLLTNILLTHIALSWDHPLPQNINNSLLTRYKEMVFDNDTETVNSNSVNVTREERNKNNNKRKLTNKQRKAKAKAIRSMLSRKKAFAARQERKRLQDRVNPPPPFGNEFSYEKPFNNYNDCFNYNNGMPDSVPFHRPPGSFADHNVFNDNQMSQSYNPAFYEDFPIFHDNRQPDIPPLMGNNFVHYRM